MMGIVGLSTKSSVPSYENSDTVFFLELVASNLLFRVQRPIVDHVYEFD